MDNISCLRCKTPMEGPFREKFQLGQQGIMNSHLAHLRAGALKIDLYHCPECGKLEMFLPNQTEPEKSVPTAVCVWIRIRKSALAAAASLLSDKKNRPAPGRFFAV